MKSKSTKIKAFTLTEMLVVLAISAIVATLAFSILSLVSGNLGAIQRNYELNTTQSLLQQQLTIDFNRYHQMSFHPSRQQLVGKTPLDSVVYSFSEKVVLRNDDTILNSEYKLQLYCQGRSVTKKAIDAIKLELTTESDQNIFVYKHNDAAQKVGNYGN